MLQEKTYMKEKQVKMQEAQEDASILGQGIWVCASYHQRKRHWVYTNFLSKKTQMAWYAIAVKGVF